jgi:hypothetical protein
VLQAALQAIAAGHVPRRVTLMVGSMLVTGTVIGPDAWLASTAQDDPVLGCALSPLLGTRELTHLDEARLTYLRGRLQWGSGLSVQQAAEFRHLESATAGQEDYVHLADVTVSSGGDSRSVPQWRGSLARIDAFSILTNSEEGQHDA